MLATVLTAAWYMMRIGCFSLNFEIANYNCSGIQIKYLKVSERGRPINPNRWIRYITYSNSYVCRV